MLRDRAAAEAAFDAPDPPVHRRRTWPTPWPPCTPWTSTPWGWATSAGATGYIERQLRRWSGQYEQTAVAGVDHGGPGGGGGRGARRLGARAAGHADRPRRLPARQRGPRRQRRGSRRLGLGDLHPGRPHGRCRPAHGLLGLRPTAASRCSGCRPPRPPPASHLGRRCSTATPPTSGRDVSDVGYYMAFGYWKLACILQGVYARYVGGAGAGDPGSVEEFPAHDRPPGPHRGGHPGGSVTPPAGESRPGYEVHRTPTLIGTGAGGGPGGLGRRRPGRGRRRHRAHGRPALGPGRHLRRRPLLGPAGAPTHRPHRRRGHHRARLAPHPGAPRP